ncbi:MAG: DUF349 domain-containing protein [Rubrivivax sp.]|nr:DUF349 domain-containing protein [Rubrivivax sp.]
MRRWIFERQRQSDNGAATPPAGRPAAAAPAAAAKAAAAAVDWHERLRAAQGDDAALLELAEGPAPLELRLAAVEALQGEAALRRVEGASRSHDRRLHSLAKRRLSAAAARRQAGEGAATVLAAARFAAAQPALALNELVELDRAWRALDARLVDGAVAAEFAALMAQMAAATRAHADRPRLLRLWTERALAALAGLEAAGVQGIEDGGAGGALAAAATAARATLDAAPPEAAPTHCELLRRGLEAADALAPRLALLDELRQLPLPLSDDDAAGEPGRAPVRAEDDAWHAWLQRWAAFAPLGRPVWDDAMRHHVAQQQQARAMAIAAHRSRLRELRRREVQQALAAALDEAEGALEAGQLTPARTLLARIERQPGTPPAAQRGRIDALQARLAQLEGWRRWAGSRARDELLQQAEALAAAVSASTTTDGGTDGSTDGGKDGASFAVSGGDPGSDCRVANAAVASDAGADAKPEIRTEVMPDPPANAEGAAGDVPGAGRADAAWATGEPRHAGKRRGKEGPELTTRQLVETITDLRARWKALDHQGGSVSHALWKRFDTALESAYRPVALQLEAQRNARARNLHERERLLAALEAVPVPAGDGTAAAAAWRSPAGRLEQFHAAWRKLGPLAHTVPPEARKPLADRADAALRRLAEPLQALRAAARAEREQLVAEARALAADAAGRDLVPLARALQARWQQHAQSLPLARADEAALWQEFRSALDGAFAARQAAFDARQAQFAVQDAERRALIERLEAVDDATPPTQIRRVLAEVQTQWQRLGAPAREPAAALEQRLRRACEAADRRLGQSAQRQWHALCDALEAKLALCLALEAAANAAEANEGSDAAAGIDQRWSAWPALPDPLEPALAGRAGLAAANPAVSRLPLPSDELLLQLEAAWGLASPSAFEAARRALKLQAMKAALETRRPAAAPPAPVQMLAELLRRPGLDGTQRARLDAVLAGLRRRGSLASR